MAESELTAQRSFADRLIGAIMLDSQVYAEIEHDSSAMGQAAAVVALSSLASGIGGVSDAGMVGSVAVILGGMIGWVLSTGLVWLVGVRFMGHTSDFQELLRTLGFASAPRLIGVLGVVPILGAIAVLAAGILGLIAYVVAVREALDVSTGRAVFVCLLAYLVVVIATIALLVVAGVGAGTTAPVV